MYILHEITYIGMLKYIHYYTFLILQSLIIVFLLTDNPSWWNINWWQLPSSQRQVGAERVCKGIPDFNFCRSSVHRTCSKSASTYSEKIRGTSTGRECTTH